MSKFSNRDFDPEPAVGDRGRREQSRGDALGDTGIDSGRKEEVVSDESLVWAKELVRRVEALFSGGVPQPPEEPARAVRTGSNGSPKAARHRRDRRDASYGSSSAAGGTGRGVDGKPGAGGPEQAHTSTKSNRAVGSAQYLNPGANRGVHMHGGSVAGGGQGGHAGDGKPAPATPESNRVASTSGRFAGCAQGANSSSNSSARLPGHSATACGNGGRVIDGKPPAAASEKAPAASSSGCSAGSADGANLGANGSNQVHDSSAAAGVYGSPALDRKPAAHESEAARAASMSDRSAAAPHGADPVVSDHAHVKAGAAGDEMGEVHVSVNNKSWLCLLGIICLGRRDHMFLLLAEAHERHQRLVAECDGSDVAELLADQVITCWLERMKCSCQEHVDSESDGARVAVRIRATDSATKRFHSALKAYHEYKSQKT